MPPPLKCSEYRYVTPWPALPLFLSESYHLGKICLEKHQKENAREAPLLFYLDAKLKHNQLLHRYFATCSSLLSMHRRALYMARVIRQCTEKYQFTCSNHSSSFHHAGSSGRQTLSSKPYFSQPSALPHRLCATHSCPTLDLFPRPPREQCFCEKTPLTFKTLGQGMALWALPGLGQSSAAGF